jgi:hypothetical protein
MAAASNPTQTPTSSPMGRVTQVNSPPPKSRSLRIAGGFWKLGAILLIFSALVCAVTQTYSERTGWPLFQLFIAAFLILVLFLVESIEMMVLTLIDKDIERLSERERDALSRLSQNGDAFRRGRQLIEITLVVVIAFCFDALFKIHFFEVKQSEPFLHSPSLASLLSLALSSLVVCWFAQLLGKLYGEKHPLKVLGWAPAQWLISVAIRIDKFQFAEPSITVWNRLNRKSPISEELSPSREMHYLSSAQLRYGRGLEYCGKTILIRKDGAVDVKDNYIVEFFGECRSFQQRAYWQAEIVKFEPTILKWPRAGKQTEVERIFSDSDIEGIVTSNGKVTWSFHFLEEVPRGERLEYETHYSTKAGAVKTRINDKDSFTQIFSQPTRLMNIEIKPEEDAPFYLAIGDCSIRDAAGEPMSNLENARVQSALRSSEDGGCELALKYPLVGTSLKISWEVVKKGLGGNSGAAAAQSGAAAAVKTSDQIKLN